jgi:hypothetical protein
MTKWFVIAMSLLSLVGVARADDTLHFTKEGFSIRSLHPPIGAQPVQVLSMQLASDGTFASNVNVQIQPFAGTMDDYIKMSLDEFAQLGLTLASKKKTSEDVVILDYTGTMRDLPLHFYARALRSKAKGVIYLVTGTALASQWAKAAPEIKACVDSLKLE